MDEKKNKEKKNVVVKEKKEEPKKEEKAKVESKFVQKNSGKDKVKGKSKVAPWVASVVTVSVVLIIAIVLTVMIVTSSDPKKSLDGLFTNLKAGEFEKAQEFITGEPIVAEEANREEIALLFDKLAWKVTKVTKEDTNATIEVEITNKNFEAVVDNYMKRAVEAAKKAIGGEQVSQEEFEKYFVEELKNEQLETKTETKTIKAVEEDKKWKIVSDEELMNALLPGLEEALSTVE